MMKRLKKYRCQAMSYTQDKSVLSKRLSILVLMFVLPFSSRGKTRPGLNNLLRNSSELRQRRKAASSADGGGMNCDRTKWVV
ncbi:Hypothetical protein NTJ_08772 [Nesidiocoris tenuis]|uniref:Uncharacterized protein n=1 Tax=Nesidiocoris tenuis TaxID=355587 RepID=A0ABN7AVJ7_9HEMI|nr:Hypothetical protein NTJ_08772 [Nesidiocoris tenuis]